ncbi:hypothetical protein AAE02nite_07240 [Adhaeribacter aerolatus]|uniref:Uncharacterized protein n=1 Tax=Adhaeribacter aerolatus TaxID=670289 RepID=A0A512ATR1_9BACT|nr:DUF5606 domain-containing protein [Adhaeribacter aerolatus]GEO03060.1 hypothetical protein AAE02nite_07240 [Adhaeribacter aerolatus]
MPVDLKDIASIAGMSGLYRVVSPSRNGIVVETLDEKNNRFVAQAKHRISLLSEISVYQQNTEETLPLAEVFDRIRRQEGQEIKVNPKSSNAELTQFMETIVPDYDRERVYISDIKKITGWYNIVSKHVPFTEAGAEENTTPEPETAENKTETATKTK